jgi:hypothetical protein
MVAINSFERGQDSNFFYVRPVEPKMQVCIDPCHLDAGLAFVPCP